MRERMTKGADAGYEEGEGGLDREGYVTTRYSHSFPQVDVPEAGKTKIAVVATNRVILLVEVDPTARTMSSGKRSRNPSVRWPMNRRPPRNEISPMPSG